MSEVQPRLQYNYARYNTTTFECTSVFTASYVIPESVAGHVLIPVYDTAYRGKYYNLNGDQRWYHDQFFTQLWAECPSHNV